MQNQSINSVSEFLLHAGTEYCVFDMGRGLSKVDTQTFLDIENGLVCAPYPRQKHAWFGIVFWNKNASENHYIWFLKFPVDEQGLVMSAARNHFLQIIVDALGQSISEDTEKAQQLPDNPYSFVPTQSQMAQFNGFVKKEFNVEPPSSSSQHVMAYIDAPQVADWRGLSIQAVADVSVCLDDTNTAQRVAKNFSLYAPEFKNTLMRASESLPKQDVIITAFIDALAISGDFCIEALAGLGTSSASELIQTSLVELLNSEHAIRVDVLSVIAARHFNQFNDAILLLFFEAAAEADEHHGHKGELFIGLFSDLVQVPSLRDSVLAMLRTPERSDTLAKAIGHLFSNTRGA
ncbi:DUF3549 family protein [Alteromonas sp. KUL49]|uniref:DUF3549 family protein n=1 Tax=Alteromonas sp. KUL49 TaxID=2480798 RepID=UPI00102F1266|nr:DUF3549 family protein [Alteromonas sp. KUL49]TAP39614.1 DUF3549 family protein [Alteromonas sp. KUL49]GEA11590.1 hypothetical protein KUL49_19650 [Alteromonas sp. KUL49]